MEEIRAKNNYAHKWGPMKHLFLVIDCFSCGFCCNTAQPARVPWFGARERGLKSGRQRNTALAGGLRDGIPARGSEERVASAAAAATHSGRADPCAA